MKELVIFDCDGTLVDTEEVACRVFREYWASNGVHVSEAEFKENIVGKGYGNPYMKELYKKLPEDAIEVGDRLWAEALRTELKPVEGMLEVVSSLQSPMAVGSNSPLDHVRNAIKDTGLFPHFGDSIFSAHQVSQPKPSPDLFLHILSVFGVRPEHAVVVEDSSSGIRAAQNAKIPVIAFTGASHFTTTTVSQVQSLKPDWHCSDSIELAKVLHGI